MTLEQWKALERQRMLDRERLETTAVDNVNHPARYNAGPIECIDAIESALTPEEFRGFLKGNILKYTWRERSKGGDESMRKAEWYLARMLAK